MEKKLGLLGAGNLGLSIAAALRRKGCEFTGVYDIDNEASAKAREVLGCPIADAKTLGEESDILLLTVPDDSIEDLYREVKDYLREDTLLVHFSGNLASTVFTSHKGISAHPAKSFPHPILEQDAFDGISFALEGAIEGLSLFSELLARLGARVFVIPTESKPLYHAICVLSSNLVLGLLERIMELSSQLGITELEAKRTILHLAQESISNAARADSIDEALSGPILRGDVSTIRSNLEALEPFGDLHRLYKLLSLGALELARKRGLPQGKASEIQKLLL